MLSGFPGSKPVKGFAETVRADQFSGSILVTGRKVFAGEKIGFKKLGHVQFSPGKEPPSGYLRICRAENSSTSRNFLSWEIWIPLAKRRF